MLSSAAPPHVFRIREATQDDAPLLHEFMVGLIAERLPVLYERSAAPSVEEEREFIRSMSDPQGGVLFVAVQDELVIGILDFHRDKRPQAAHGGVFGMSVGRGHRGQGVGALF
jgi:RimJ/RimL family protein N-acetyltransferase